MSICERKKETNQAVGLVRVFCLVLVLLVCQLNL